MTKTGNVRNPLSPRTFQPRRLAFMLAIAISPAACDLFGGGEEGGGETEEDLTIVVEADKSRILEEEQALEAKRSQMTEEQQRIEAEKTALAEKLASLSKKDRKSRETLEAEQQRLLDEEIQFRSRRREIEAEREKLAAEKNALLEKITTLATSGGGAGGKSIEQRETAVAQREKALAHREAQLATREAKVADVEKQAAESLRQINEILAQLQAGGGFSKTVVVSAPAAPAASGATRVQAMNAQKTARKRMDGKGILIADLPPTTRSSLEGADKALGAKSYDEAVDGYNNVIAAVDATKIDRRFIEGKMTRLNKAAQATNLDPAKRKKLQGLLAEVGEAATDGRYDRANRKANQIAGLLRGK